MKYKLYLVILQTVQENKNCAGKHGKPSKIIQSTNHNIIINKTHNKHKNASIILLECDIIIVVITFTIHSSPTGALTFCWLPPCSSVWQPCSRLNVANSSSKYSRYFLTTFWISSCWVCIWAARCS